MSLHLSVIKGDWKSCLKLLSDDTCDVNAKERTGGTPLMVAASMMEVDLEVVKKMLERGAKIDDVDDEVRIQTVYEVLFIDTLSHSLSYRDLQRFMKRRMREISEWWSCLSNAARK